MQKQLGLVGSFGYAPGRRQRDRHADHPQEEREYQVSKGPAVPFGVFQRHIGGLPGSRVVHQNHRGDRASPENIERKQPGALRYRRGGLDFRLIGNERLHGVRIPSLKEG